eukprot:scaffold141910_cov27-Prasinocladus_malaysianus.AAC.1
MEVEIHGTALCQCYPRKTSENFSKASAQAFVFSSCFALSLWYRSAAGVSAISCHLHSWSRTLATLAYSYLYNSLGNCTTGTAYHCSTTTDARSNGVSEVGCLHTAVCTRKTEDIELWPKIW